MPSMTGTGLCVLPEGLLTVRTSLSGSWISIMLLPPPSRLMDWVQLRIYILSARLSCLVRLFAKAFSLASPFGVTVALPFSIFR
jgi:hypothetical protein